MLCGQNSKVIKIVFLLRHTRSIILFVAPFQFRFRSVLKIIICIYFL